jgi:hypothetical protein
MQDVLVAELETEYSPISEQRPCMPLGRGGLAAQLSRERKLLPYWDGA